MGGWTRWAGVAESQGELVQRKGFFLKGALREGGGGERGVRHSRGNVGDVSDRVFCMKGPNQSEGSERNRKAAGKKKIRSDFCLRQERVGEGTK